MPERLDGVIERITFHNLDNGYCVLKVQAKGHRDVVTVVGHSTQLIAGEFVEATGEWQTDRNHGPQFKATEIKSTPPHTSAGIVKYLGSGLVKGIGPRYAAKIVEVFGDRTLDVIDKSPTFLNQVKGIGAKRIELIRVSWKENQAVHRIMTFLQSFGIGTARAVRIYKTYGDTAIDKIRQNPYCLSDDIWGVGFRTADELALKIGLDRNSPKRAQAAVRHVLKVASSQGHVALPEELVREQTVALTQIESNGVNEAIEALRIAGEVFAEVTPTERLLYLKPLYLAEVGLARSLSSLLLGQHPLPKIDAAKALAWVESKMSIAFAEQQRAAVLQATTQKVSVLTGGPGTGKTTIVRAILEIFVAKNLRVGLCAPTGRAAKRLSESTGREASTIHRLLEFDAVAGKFTRNRDNPLDIDLLVIDETSMLDGNLAHNLIRAVPASASVLFVGDRDQLPSVGPGNVLGDIIDSNSVPVVRLTEVHRQASSSYIIRAAHDVNSGKEPHSAPTPEGDFFFVEADEPSQILDRIVKMVRDRIPQKFGLDPFRDIQVLSPMNKSELGVGNLNAVLQAALNPSAGPSKEVTRFGIIFRAKDKVIQTRNNYQREVFNGDIGRISKIDQTDQVVIVEFDGREVIYDFSDLDELQLAYCTSIHKSQGSEYPALVIPVHTQHFVMLQRNLLYTGITRGRKLVALVGSRKALWLAVTRAEENRRFTRLKYRLQQPPTTGPENEG